MTHEITAKSTLQQKKVSATIGVALKGFETVRPRVSLAPFRTFLEVEQPESEFLLRVSGATDGQPPQIGIIEAAGGVWKLKAKQNIATYFKERLVDFVEGGRVIVAE